MAFRFFDRLVLSVIVLPLAVFPACTRRDNNSAETTTVDVGPCREGSGFDQRHGTSCLCCHKEFGVGGSVAHDAGVATILVTDRNGRELEIAPNPFDNFFRHYKLTPPLRATIVFQDGNARAMEAQAPHGSCNACHGEVTKPLGER